MLDGPVLPLHTIFWCPDPGQFFAAGVKVSVLFLFVGSVLVKDILFLL